MTEQELQVKIDQWIEEHQEQMIADAIQLVKIKSVSQRGEGGYPYGTGCARVLEEALKLAAENTYDIILLEY